MQKALEAGAVGYLLKEVSADELAGAIRAAYNRRPTFSPSATQLLMGRTVQTKMPPPGSTLTRRERDVLALLVQGIRITYFAVIGAGHGGKAMAAHLALMGFGVTLYNHPGRTCGTIEFAKVLAEHGCQAAVTVAEAETLIYASRSEGPAQARIFSIKEAVPLAALPARVQPTYCKRWRRPIPSLLMA